MNGGESEGSYYVSLEPTTAFNRFWDHSHSLFRLGSIAGAGIMGALETRDEFGKKESDDVWANLNESMLIRLVDSSQSYCVDLLGQIFSVKPEMIVDVNINAKLLFEINSLSELRAAVVATLATKYSFMNVVYSDSGINRKYKFKLFPSHIRQLRIRRIVELRNAIVHNRSKISAKFISVGGAKVDVLGEQIKFPHPALIDTYLMSAAEDIDRRAKSVFQLPRGNDGNK